MNAARRLALGRLISLMGGSAAYIALIATLYGRTGSAAWVSAALFAVVGATFVVSAVFVASIRRSFGQGGGTESHPGVLAGVRVIRREPMLRLLVAASMTSLLGIGIVNVAAYPLSLRLGGGTEGYGAMEALLGGGGLVGAALAARLLTTARAPA